MKIITQSFYIITIALLTFSCNKDTFDYKYSNEPDFLNCNHPHKDLLKEAFYTFENDIASYYGKYDLNPNPISNYSKFIIKGVNGSARYFRLVTPHTKKVFEALKEIDGLWDENNQQSKLNYNSEIISCIGNNINDEDLKATFKSLISVNSMSPKLFGSPLIPKYQQLITDKHLALYVALDLYYERLFDADLSADQPIKRSKNKTKQVEDHSGHNH